MASSLGMWSSPGGGVVGGGTTPDPEGGASIGMAVEGWERGEESLGEAIPLGLVVQEHGGPNGFFFSFAKGDVGSIFVKGGPEGRGLIGAFGAAKVAMAFDQGGVEVLGFGRPA